jgi:pimeloyl-ACP methyl ester carboxylesterase
VPRDPRDVVTALHDLLAAAAVPGPYVMAGHSLGGSLSVLYARTYPDGTVRRSHLAEPAGGVGLPTRDVEPNVHASRTPVA